MAGETLRFTVLGRGDASDLDRLAAAVDNITDHLKALDRQRADPTIDIDTRRAQTKIGKFAKDMQRTLTRAIESLPDIELDADASEAQREIREIRSELVALNDKRVGIDIGAEEAQREVAELEARLRRLAASDVDVQVRTDAAAALAELRVVNSEVDKLDGRTATVKVKVDSRGFGGIQGLLKGLTGQQGFTKFATSLMAVGAAATAATASVGGLVAATASLGGALVATGPILLAGAGMIGGVLATIKVATQGLGQAFEALAEGDMKNWGKALANLSPNARSFAEAVRGVWTELRQAKGAVQDNFFQGMDEAVTRLASQALPMLKAGMGAVATELGSAAKSVLEYVGNSEGVARQQSMWSSTATVVRNLSPWLTNVTAAMFDIGEVGGRVLADITSGAGEAGLGFRQMIADARESGELEAAMRRGVEVLRQLGSIAGNVGSVLASIFTAAQTAGSDFLTTLERGTAALAEFMRSGAGQTALVDFFRESRATLDALGEGLVAAGEAAAAFVSAFSNTGGLSAAAQGLSDLMAAVAPLLPALGELAGNTLGMLGAALSAVSAVIGPVASALAALLGALGPITPAVAAMVLAFAGTRAIVGWVAGIGAAMVGLVTKVTSAKTAASGLGATIAQIEGKAGGGATATSRLSKAFSALGTAVPIAAAALVAVIALYEQAASKADESAKAILNGSMSMQQGIQTEVGQLENRNAAYRAANIEGQEFASVQQNVGASTRGLQTEQSRLTEGTEAQTKAVQEQYDKLSPFEKLQADVAMAQRELNDALAANDAAGAAAAADKLSVAQAKLAAVTDTASEATKTHEERLVELADTMREGIGAALSLEQSQLRVEESQKSANEALKEYGADSSEYRSAVLDLAQAQLAQADAARKVGEETAGAAGGAAAFTTELLKMDTTTQSGKDAFAKIAQGLSTTELNALSAAAAASGLRTEIITLPDGREVRVVIDADKSKLDAAKAAAEELVKAKYTGKVTILGDPKPFQDGFLQAVRLADGTTAMLKLNADKTPAEITIQGVKYAIDSTTGTLKVLSDVSEGEATLDGFQVKVDSATGEFTILGKDGSVASTTDALVGYVGGKTGVLNIDGDPTQVEGKTQYAVSNIDGQKATITIDGEPNPATGAVDATITYADGKTAQIKFNPETGEVTAAIDTLSQPTTSEHTITVNDSAVTTAKATAAGPTSSMHTINVTDNVPAAKTAAALPTSSMHTINVTNNVPAATSANAAGTSSTHTINVTNNVPAAKSTNAGATSSTHTINVTNNVPAAKTANGAATSSMHTINVTDNVPAAKTAASQPSSSLHTLNCDDKAVLDAKSRAEQPTSSMHTINCNDQAVRDAKSRAQQGTSSTHTIHVVTVGGPPNSGGGVYGYSGGGVRGNTVARAAGGMVLKGYAPGRDTIPAVLSAGEAVLVPELVRMLGARRILAANKAASGGREATVIGQLAGMMDGTVGRYAGGGVAAPRMAGGGYSAPMPRWSTSGGSSKDALARGLQALAEELRGRGGKDVNIVNNFAIANASQAADEVSRTQRVAGAIGIFG